MTVKDSIVIFEKKNIRRLWYNNEWFFSVVDVIGAITESSEPRRYWSDLKIKIRKESNQLYDFFVQLKMPANDGKYYETDCVNIKALFRLIQSIPSPKVEPFKLWLAKIGYQRVQEIQDPEIIQKRMVETYKQKGYSDTWIEKRIRGIAIRDELTDEWKNKGIQEKKEFSILTA